jgi:uncharacterized protein
MKAFRFILTSILLLLGVLYIIYLSYVYFNQSEMVFRASKLPKDYAFEFKDNFEEITIPSFDGVKLNGLLFKAVNSKGLIFYLHGNAGALDRWGKHAEIYTRLGYDIFFLDYRGFGKSEGEIDDQAQVYKDVTLAYETVLKRYDKSKTIIIGYSIGTGIAAYLASKEQPKMLVLQAPYFNFTEFTTGRVPFYPDTMKKFSFETDKYIVKVKAPVYLFHGKQDNLISYENALQLQALFKPKDSLFSLENQGHVGMNDNYEFQTKLQQLLR